MKNYAVVSLETHLFFARIMREHSLFLEAGFPGKDRAWIQRADMLRNRFNDLLREAVRLSNGVAGSEILDSQEIVTPYTLKAEQQTKHLTGIPIDTALTVSEQNLRPGCSCMADRNLADEVKELNQRALRLLDELIAFKEALLGEVGACRLFNANYPLLIQHILREAKLYREIIRELERNGSISDIALRRQEDFWNRIMMEHALFIRGLLDPTEEELIQTANNFANEYRELLRLAKERDLRTIGLTEKSLQETLKYQKFKTAGAEGILNCKIASIILPLLADHVLREANHYIRILGGKG
ncbi:MAG: DUF2935 domain-containing protein [Lachnospiraceae bacterium]